jgi:DNA polymerase-3 subunit epsilon
MVSAAPTFDEVATLIADRIDGLPLVAHNLSFDTRMLGLEYQRLGAQLDPGVGFCTLRATGTKLLNACSQHGIELKNHHRALSDARACAEIFRRVIDQDQELVPSRVFNLERSPSIRTLRREATSDEFSVLPVTRLLANSPYPSSEEAVISYLDALDWVLDDLVIDEFEAQKLSDLANALGLNDQKVALIHEAYYRSVLSAALRDGVVTSEEHELLRTVSEHLRIDSPELPTPTSSEFVSSKIETGWKVCFTGEATFNGVSVKRSEIEAAAAEAGLYPIANVTKVCDLLVCVDVSSMSGKAKKAKASGVAMMDYPTFFSEIGFTY